ncbi:hypothetical protein SAMN05444396_103337 [Flavobacterium segetis]|uniref:Holin-X, holin superfamily III n=1 Tax=Flavobacterium segetis TaxID=271157 RepID=A0A1M5G8R5_9FLAO|nr:competence protein [Flavobacterium segetis]SHF99852.1 hypothetical protein SAMN05444396_103337 [Flavobacterium segetis]
MAFEELKENTEFIQENIHDYIKTNVSYYKLLGFKIAVKSISVILKFSIIFICLIIVLLFCSVAGALAIGKYIDNYPLGFLIIAGLFLVIALFLIVLKSRIGEKPVLKKFSEIFFND